MPKRSPRLISAYWDARDELPFETSRRYGREIEHFRDLPQLFADAQVTHRRTIYTYGKRVRAKGFRFDGMHTNNLTMRTTSRYVPGRGVSEFALMKRAMAVFITCWEPYVCSVRTKALDALIPDPGPFRAGWMIYIHPALADTITVPNVPVAEPTPDGGLFLAATTRPFKAEDPEHLAAAQRIAVALAHLNVERPLDMTVPRLTQKYHSINCFEARDRVWLGTILTRITPDQVLCPDATNHRVYGRVGPPDGAWEADMARNGPCDTSVCFAPL